MKKAALVFAFVLIAAIPASAQQVRVTVHRSPLRAEPTTASAILHYYEIGAVLDLLDVTNGWCRVRDVAGKREGYIKATLVEVVTPPGPRRPAAAGRGGPQAPPKPGVRAILDVGLVWMTAADSFKAVADTNMRMQYGGGIQAVNLWEGLFAEFTAGRSTLSGSRVFVYDGTVYDLGIPVAMTFTLMDVGAGWRAAHTKRLHSYVGAGVTVMKYREESDFAAAEDNVDETLTGFYAAGGVEFMLAKWLHLRGEVRYTSLPDALGAGGVSADFSETNLGGVAAAVKVAIGR